MFKKGMIRAASPEPFVCCQKYNLHKTSRTSSFQMITCMIRHKPCAWKREVFRGAVSSCKQHIVLPNACDKEETRRKLRGFNLSRKAGLRGLQPLPFSPRLLKSGSLFAILDKKQRYTARRTERQWHMRR